MKFKLNEEFINYDDFYDKCQLLINDALANLNKFLKYYGFIVEYVNDYFDEDDGEHNNDWIGAFCSDIQSDVRVFPVAINLPLLYKFMEKKGDIDWQEVKYHIEMTLAHECGHGIFNFLADYEDELDDVDVEDVVEEFGLYYMGETSYSKLIDLLDNYSNTGEDK